MSARAAAWLVLAVAAALRFAHVLTIGDYPLFDVLPLDSESYDAWARAIAHGEWTRGAPFYQAPLYAYFLAMLHAITGGDLLVPRLANAAMGVATVALVMRTSRKVFGAWPGVIAGALCAVHATFLFEEGKVMKTPLGVLLITATLAALLEARGADARARRWAVAAGLLGGMAALVRENFLLFVAAVVVGKFARRERAAAALVALGAAVALLPSTVHNFAMSGELLPITSQAGQNFFTGVHPGNPYGGYLVPDFVRRSPRFEETDFAAEAERRAGRELTPGEVSRYWMRAGLRAVGASPVRFARLFVTKLGLLYHDHEIPDDEDIRFFRQWAPVLRLPLPGFGWIAVPGLVGLAMALARRRREAAELALFVVMYSVSVALFFVFSRYRLPLVAPLAVFAGHAIHAAVRALRRRDWRPLSAGVVCALFAAAIVFRPLDAPASLENSHLSAGIAYEVKGEPEEAWVQYRAGLALAPDHPKLLRRAAGLRFERDVAAGLPPSAETLDLLERAVATNPGDIGLRSRYGASLAVTGSPEKALAQFRAVITNGAEPPGIHVNIALALEQLGRFDEAREEARLAVERAPDDAAAAELARRLGVGRGSGR